MPTKSVQSYYLINIYWERMIKHVFFSFLQYNQICTNMHINAHIITEISDTLFLSYGKC